MFNTRNRTPFVIVFIKDNGIGIDKEMISRLLQNLLQGRYKEQDYAYIFQRI
jgi:signal transduction histidine kinase